MDDDNISDDLATLEEAEPLEGKDWLDVARDATVFQFKLLVDGLLDIIMVPVSLVAAGMSIVTKEDWFYRTIRVGRKMDERLNLFGCAEEPEPSSDGPPDDQIEALALRVEREIRRELADGKLRDSARDSLSRLRKRLEGLGNDKP